MHIHTIQLNIEKLVGGTVHMDATEFGAYMSLIVAAYQSGNKLPDDDRVLSRMARVTGHKWAKIRPIIEAKFVVKNGFWEQKFIKKDLLRCESLSKKNKANALKNNNTPKPVGKPNGSQTTANTSIKYQVSNNSSKKKTIKEKKYDKNFLDIWEVWPKKRKGNEDKAYSAYKSALKRDTEENINKGIQEYINSDEAKGDYAKGCAAWLNDDRWAWDYEEKAKEGSKWFMG